MLNDGNDGFIGAIAERPKSLCVTMLFLVAREVVVVFIEPCILLMVIGTLGPTELGAP
jgi:hypothetical protein